MTKEEIMQAIESMTVLELSELVKAMEEKFGVSAAQLSSVTSLALTTFHVHRSEFRSQDWLLHRLTSRLQNNISN